MRQYVLIRMGRRDMNVQEIMVAEVVIVDMDTRLSSLNKILQQEKIHHLLVVENAELVGIVSDRDILRTISPFLDTPNEQPKDRHTLDIKTHHIMSRNPITVSGDTSLREAIILLVSNDISCLPVINGENKIAGIITWKDLLEWSVDALR